MDRLAFDCELKLAGDGDKTGTVDGYASMFNLLDRGGDIVLPGAFKASLADWKRRKALPPMLWQHDPTNPVGVWTDLAEDEHGLKVTGELVLDVPQAASARALMLAGAVKGLSIGYRTIDHEIDRTTGVRKLKKLDLWEVSLVTFPMLREAQLTGVKAAVEDLAGAIEWLGKAISLHEGHMDGTVPTSAASQQKMMDQMVQAYVLLTSAKRSSTGSMKADFDPRELERELRSELKLSSAAAVRAVALFRKHLREGDGHNEQAARDGKSDLLMSLRKAGEALR